MHFPILLLGLEHIGIHILFLKDSWHADFLFIQRCFLRGVFSHSILDLSIHFELNLSIGRKQFYLFFEEERFSGFSFDLQDYPIQYICAEQSFDQYPVQQTPKIWGDELSLLLSRIKIDAFWSLYRYINFLTFLHKDFNHVRQSRKVLGICHYLYGISFYRYVVLHGR